MIKRKDLVKEFELVVQQEIKNHRDLMQAHNLALEELRKQIASLEKKNADEVRQLKNCSDESCHKHRDAECKLVDIYRLLNKMECDWSVDFGRLENQVEACQEEFRMMIRRVSALETRTEQLAGQHTDIEARESQRRDNFMMEVEKELKRTRRYADSAINELRNQPSEALGVKDELLKAFECHKVNVKGIYEDIGITRKQLNYMEKKIEDLYNQIRRLGKKVGA